MGYVYFIKPEGKDVFKIGMTNKTPEGRLQEIQVSYPEKLEVYGCIHTPTPRNLERQLHEQFDEYRVRGEWFSIPTQIVKDFIDNHPDKVEPDYIILEQGRRTFLYRISDGKLFVALESLARHGFSTLYVASIMAATHKHVYFIDRVAFDYDLLIEDFPEMKDDLETHKLSLIQAAKDHIEEAKGPSQGEF